MTDGGAWLRQGNALLEQGRGDEAIACYRKAIAADPGAAGAYNNLAVALRDQGQLEQATATCRQALALDADYPDALITLAEMLLRGGSREEAVAAARRVLALSGRAPSNPRAFGRLLARCGLSEDARMVFDACLRLDPGDRQGIRLTMAQLALAATPDRAAPAFLDALYDRRARDWDRSAAHQAKYRAPWLVAEAFLQIPGRPPACAVLDAGCGTGLVGALIRAAVSRLEGVDLSAPMLDQARQKNVYDELFHGDLVAFLSDRNARYDAVLAAATLIHFGDLRPVFEAVARALRGSGWFVFSVFPLTDGGDDFAVAPADSLALFGCFAHSQRYLEQLAGATGYDLVGVQRVVHEYSDGRPVEGLVVAARRRSGAGP